ELKPGKEKDADHRTVLQKLFTDIAPRYLDRPGGYTRIIKRHERRLGDAGHTAFLELLKEGETKVRARPAAPAPRVDEEEEETRAPEEQAPAQESQAPAPEGQAPAAGTPEPG